MRNEVIFFKFQANNFARRQSCFKCKKNKDGSEDKFEFRNGLSYIYKNLISTKHFNTID